MIFKGEPTITTIVLHHTAVSRGVQPLQLNAVNNYHKQKWNSKSELDYYVGYNFFCEPTGKRTQTRKIGEETIAQIGNNCDVPERCGMVSYCMAGSFDIEKPTQQQINDFVEFYREIKQLYPDVIVKQHKDVHPGRTCACLPNDEVQGWLTIQPSNETDEQKITRLTSELDVAKKQIKQLIDINTKLLQLVAK